MRLQPKNWEKFQHYKDRVPPWIKLHRELLDDYEFHLLPIASKALAPFLWLLASEYKDAIIDAPIEKITFRLRMTDDDFRAAIDPLIKSGFFVMYRDASGVLAGSEQGDHLEERRGETEEEKEEEKEVAESDLKSLPAVEVIPEDPPFITLPLIDKTEFLVSFAMVEEFSSCYPAVDVEASFRAMRAWCISNPRQRKTRTGILRFVNIWLSKDQDRGGGKVSATGKGSTLEHNIEAAREAGRRLGVGE